MQAYDIPFAKQLMAAGFANLLPQAAVAPHVGAWIETVFHHPPTLHRLVAPHVGAWIETSKQYSPA